MMHNRKFWVRHVEGWRSSGLSQRSYCRRHHLTKGTLGYWSSKLKRPQAAARKLVEVGHAEVKERKGVGNLPDPAVGNIMSLDRSGMEIWLATPM
jgi:hypothetical protein